MRVMSLDDIFYFEKCTPYFFKKTDKFQRLILDVGPQSSYNAICVDNAHLYMYLYGLALVYPQVVNSD